MNNLIEQLKKEYQGKKVLVVGLGIQGSGLGVTKFFAELGANVTVTDSKPADKLQSSLEQLQDYEITYVLGEHREEDFLNADMIVKGPAVPWTMPHIVAAQQKGIPIEMEGSFFAAYCPAPIIGITGTRGKSTTTQMIYEVMKKTDKIIHLAGNIPQVSTITLLHTIEPEDIVILELSSWQLSGFHKKQISPHVAVFTNFYPDHLNYYKSMDEYLFDKKAIYLYQNKGDYLIANKNLKNDIEQDIIESNVVYFDSEMYPADLQLKGKHNQENAAAALQVALVMGVDREKAIHAISSFGGLPYRQQIIGNKDGIVFVNDTTSTTPTAAMRAIESFTDKPLIHILGGNSKGLPTDELLTALAKVDTIVLLKGSFTDEIMSELKKRYEDKLSAVYDSLDQALTHAYAVAQQKKGGAYILFSPAATSFAMFKNEFDRGDHFNVFVKKIINT